MSAAEPRSDAIVSDRERSLALHEAVAQMILVDATILTRARLKLDEWIERGGRSTPLWARWRQILARTPKEIAEVLVSPSEEAAWLRKASPFAGVLDPRHRWKILRSLRRPARPTP